MSIIPANPKLLSPPTQLHLASLPAIPTMNEAAAGATASIMELKRPVSKTPMTAQQCVDQTSANGKVWVSPNLSLTPAVAKVSNKPQPCFKDGAALPQPEFRSIAGE